jgi:4-carboxymuconolactone decarboxylase
MTATCPLSLPIPRIAPLTAPFDAELEERLKTMSPPGATDFLALFRILAVNPLLADRATVLGRYFLGRKAGLPLRDREVVIDRTCARCGAEYEWGVHVTAFAAAANFSDAQIADIAILTSPGASLTARDRLLVRMVDELHASCDISEPLWRELAVVWSEAQLIELLLLAGWYRAISYLCNAIRLPLESWQARFPASGAPACAPEGS